MTHILYATNRTMVPGAEGSPPQFSDVAAPLTPDGLLYGAADIANIDIGDPSSGTIATLRAPNPRQFSAGDLAPVLASQNDILVFVHGAANAFTDAITRAAYNKTWLGAGTVPGVSSVCDVIAFSWPARAYTIANIVSDYVNYRHDQTEAAASAGHFGLFLQQIAALRAHISKRRINLLCHSMGNYMLAGAVGQIFGPGGTPLAGPPLFDQIVLAAADEVDSSFATPNGGRLAHLPRLGRSITIYFNRDDVAMALSHVANKDIRIGYNGPLDKANAALFPRNVYSFVDCTGVNDYLSSFFSEPDRSHQYYRQSPTVRADIIAALAGAALQRPRYDPVSNASALFPPVLVAETQGVPGNAA